jgi:hypothetical protein
MPSALRRKPLPKPSPESDPRYRRVMEQLKQGASRTKKHPPAAKKAADAASAAKGPANERVAGGKAKQVDKIKEAKEGKPEQASFLSILRAEIEKVMPKTLGATDNFDSTAQQMKGGLKGNVADQKDKSTQDVSGASKATPGPAGEAKAGGNVPPEAAGSAPNVAASEGMPSPKSESDVSLQDSKQDVDAQMKEAEVTPQQLQKANDPRFSAVLDAKGKVAQNADTGPGKYRAQEKATLSSTAAKASSSAKAGAAAMLGVRTGGNAKVLTRQQQQKADDEKKRKDVVDKIESIYTATKGRVETKLNALDGEVNGMFDRGVDAALNAMTSFVNGRIRKYKIDRYLSIPLLGLAAWIKDQFVGLPDEVNAFYEQGRQLFQAQMDGLIVRVANVVETRLREAKQEVAKGQQQIKDFVASQPKDLQAVAKAAASEVNGKFEELERGIEDKKNSLAQSLAQKYKEGFDKANEALKKIQDENKGFVQAFAEKLGEVIKAIMEFKAKLQAILAKGEATIKLIIADPIGFLGNLIAAVKGGLSAFVGNIWTHLKKGFMAWLFGNMPPGVAPPSDLSLPSIFKLVMGVLGITYDRMRAKAVKLLGERTVGLIEKLVSYIQTLIGGGPAALWEQVKGDLATLKGMVIDAIQDWLITTIVKNAIAKIVSMFNPAGAIIQAIMAIYNIVMFVIERAAQIMTFVESVINSVHAIATGAIGGAIKAVESALANAIPIVIGFLARLIGLGGISQKIREFIMRVQAKVDAAIDKVLKKIVDTVKKLFGKLTGKDKKPDDRTEADKKKDLKLAAGEARSAASSVAKPSAMKPKLKAIKAKYRLTTLKVEAKKGQKVHFSLTINPEEEADGETKKTNAKEAVQAVVSANTAGDSLVEKARQSQRELGAAVAKGGADYEKSRREALNQRPNNLAIPSKPQHNDPTISDSEDPQGLDAVALVSADPTKVEGSVLEINEIKKKGGSINVLSTISSKKTPKDLTGRHVVPHDPTLKGSASTQRVTSDPAAMAAVNRGERMVQEGADKKLRTIENKFSAITSGLVANLQNTMALMKAVPDETLSPAAKQTAQDIVNNLGGTIRIGIDLKETATMSQPEKRLLISMVNTAFGELMANRGEVKTKLEIVSREVDDSGKTVPGSEKKFDV